MKRGIIVYILLIGSLTNTSASRTALISDSNELNSITSHLDNLNVFYQSYYNNSDRHITKNTSLLFEYDLLIIYKENTPLTREENTNLNAYLNSGRKILLSGVGVLVAGGISGNTYLSDILEVSFT